MVEKQEHKVEIGNPISLNEKENITILLRCELCKSNESILSFDKL